MTKRNPYERLAHIGSIAEGVALAVLTVTFLGAIGFYAAAKLGWWALLFIPGLALMVATVAGLAWLEGVVSRWWHRKSSQWESRNRRTIPTDTLISKNGES